MKSREPVYMGLGRPEIRPLIFQFAYFKAISLPLSLFHVDLLMGSPASSLLERCQGRSRTYLFLSLSLVYDNRALYP